MTDVPPDAATDSQSQPWDVSPSNLAWVEEQYLAYQQDPASVDESWQQAFQRMDRGEPLSLPGIPGAINGNGHGAHNGNGNNGHGPAPVPVSALTIAPAAQLRTMTPVPTGPDGGIAAAAGHRAVEGKRIRRLIEDYRDIGHLAANLDPLGLINRRGNLPNLEDYGLGPEDMDMPVSVEEIAGLGTVPLRELIGHLEETYCRTIGVELAHIHDAELRGWLLSRIETTRNRKKLTRNERLHLLSRVTEAEIFEQFLATKFVGAKRFSLEGAESLIPLVDRMIERAAAQGVAEVVIGMAHRGRLNVLANILGKPPAEIFAEFVDKTTELTGEPGGDVKYHLGYSIDRITQAGKVHISLAFNPSHLEFVNPVVQGRVRAKQDRMGDARRERGIPILIHGDAAFAGQGIVYETFNMSGLDGYTVGGTIHVIVNNQIGFTTSPRSAYAMTYPSDVARVLQVPIFHINGEDPEAVAQVVDIAVEFRQRFKRDVVIDMWCYRKLGHNEADEPAFTQPVMYRRIAEKAPVRLAFLDAFAKADTTDRAISLEDAEAVVTQHRQALDDALEAAKKFLHPPKPSTFAGVWSRIRGGPDSAVRDVPTVISRDTIDMVGRAITTVPAGFTPHPKVAKLLEQRAAMAAGKKPMDWGMAELLAYGSLVGEGVRVRLSGQDVRRGTFSHRHSVLIDNENGNEYSSLAHIGPGQAMFEACDSPLSEAGVLGFEYGYSLDTPNGLVIWEAQFGDFVNGAQVIIDQFLVSSEAKWRRVSGLVMLLPHGMEGQGPEHSSGRLERFLNMAVNDNIIVANVTTPAQFFHLLRRQVLRSYRKPLIVMTPKLLLRHAQAVSNIEDLTDGRFRNVLADPGDIDPKAVDRILLCSGKVYYDLVAAREEHKVRNVAILRVEQLYPLRIDEILDLLSIYPEGSRVIWVQEEARNMGAWAYMSRVLPSLLASTFHISGISRPLSASPATGSGSRHKLEHAKLMEEALGLRAARRVMK